MLESISVKEIATYDHVGITLNSLKKINFIYGANGCGKTTISKFINSPTDSAYSKCSLLWKADSPLEVLVYNKDFRDNNFGRGKLPGVLR